MKLWFERGAWASRRGKRVTRAIEPCSVKKILVIRHAALGDMVLVRPFLIEVRNFFKNAEIVFSVVSNYQYGIPSDLVDRVDVLPGSDQKIGFIGWISHARKLGAIDILFDLADTARSRYLSLFTRAVVKVGFPYRIVIRKLIYDVAVPRSDFTFEALNMLDLLMIFGANPKIPLDYGRKIADKKIKRIVYFPFASVASKCWKQERFFLLIKQMATKHLDFNHFILNGIGGEDTLSPFAELDNTFKNIHLQASMGLVDLENFLGESALVISNDTGIRNLAIAVGTNTVGIFFSTVPFRYFPKNTNHRIIFEADGEQPSIEAVVAAADTLLTKRNFLTEIDNAKK